MGQKYHVIYADGGELVHRSFDSMKKAEEYVTAEVNTFMDNGTTSFDDGDLAEGYVVVIEGGRVVDVRINKRVSVELLL